MLKDGLFCFDCFYFSRSRGFPSFLSPPLGWFGSFGPALRVSSSRTVSSPFSKMFCFDCFDFWVPSVVPRSLFPLRGEGLSFGSAPVRVRGLHFLLTAVRGLRIFFVGAFSVGVCGFSTCLRCC